jgi:protein TonB
LRLSALTVALALHGALVAGGLVFDWFGAGAVKEATVTALVTLIPAAKPEATPPPPPPPPRLDAIAPPVVLPPITSITIDAPVAAVAPIVRPAPSAALPGYLARLSAHLERHKRYPDEARRRGQEGEALVRFTIDRAGNVLAFRLVKSSGVPALDAEIRALLQRAAPLPPMPAALSQSRLTVELPIGFSMRKPS